MKQIVILGGGYAGTLAAVRLAGRLKKEAVQITLVNGTADFVERIRLHQVAAGQTENKRPFSQLLAGTAVQFVQGWVSQLHIAQRQVVLADGRTLPYDYLIYALGSAPAVGHITGTAEHAHTLGNPATAHALHEQLTAVASHAGRVLVIGGGLTGIEAAAELAEQYPTLAVTLATAGTFGADLHPNGAAYLRQQFGRLGVHLHENSRITHLTAGMAHTAVGSPMPFDVCLSAVSFSVSPLAREAGLAVDEQGRAVVNGALQAVGHPEMYVVGDAAAAGLRMACATAMPQGAYVADHLAAVVRGTAVPQPFRFGYMLRCISLGRRAGLVQVVDSADKPQPRVLTGWLGARVKELICRSTIWGILLEKKLPGSYRWPQGVSQPVSLSASQLVS